MNLLKAEMTPTEELEMKKLSQIAMLPKEFESAYRMGFLAGKVSTLTDVINNHKTLFGNDEPPGSKRQSPTGSEERVAPEGEEGDTGPVHGIGEDEASD